MNDKTTTNYREKYLDSLDEQERMQARFDQQVELLRRAVVRVSLAAQGHDAGVDEDLERLRNSVRDEKADLEAAIGGVEASLLKYDKSRADGSKVFGEAMAQLAEGFSKQTQDRNLLKQLKAFSKQASKSSEEDSAALMATLVSLQAQAFEGDSEPSQSRPSLLERFLGKNEPTSAASLPSSSPAPAVVVAQAESATELALEPTGELEPNAESESTAGSELTAESAATPPASPAAEPSAITGEPEGMEPSSLDLNHEPAELLTGGDPSMVEGRWQTQAEAQAEDEREAVLVRPVHEPAFSRVSDKLLRVLSELLDNVEPVASTEQKAQNARERIERGLNWYELVPTLEDIRDLVLHAYVMANQEFQAYLQQIHEVLDAILAALGVSLETQQQWLKADEAFEFSLNEQLDSLGRSMAVASDVDALKHDINHHLSEIQAALATKHATTHADDLSDQLASLVAQVKQVEQEAAETRKELETQKEKAITDALTGLPNREAYNERAFHEWSRWQRYGHPLSMAVCDIDHFKKINDTYGHQAGDRVLQVLSKAISQRLREVDFMARYGGEEFVILLPETPQSDALRLMDKIRSVIAATPFRFKQNPVQVTLSMGVVGLKQGDSIEKAFARADQLLYRAKDEGRNRCVSDDA